MLYYIFIRLCILGYDILDVNCFPRESMVQSSAPQIADGKIILFTVNSVLILYHPSVLRAHNPDASLEHSTSLTPHYAVPWTTAIDFRSAKHNTTPHAVSLVARQIHPPSERWPSWDFPAAQSVLFSGRHEKVIWRQEPCGSSHN
jgi:hypothetical protein